MYPTTPDGWKGKGKTLTFKHKAGAQADWQSLGHTEAAARLSSGGPFVTFEAGGSSDTKTLDTKHNFDDEEVEISFQAVGLKPFHIRPGDWFAPLPPPFLVSRPQLQELDVVDFARAVGGTQTKFSQKIVVDTLIMAYGVNMSFKFSSDGCAAVRKSCKEAAEVGGGVSFLGMHFGDAGGKTQSVGKMSDIKFVNDGQTVTFQSQNDKMPILLGVKANKIGTQ